MKEKHHQQSLVQKVIKEAAVSVHRPNVMVLEMRDEIKLKSRGKATVVRIVKKI
jgi:hypothetical protein